MTTTHAGKTGIRNKCFGLCNVYFNTCHSSSMVITDSQLGMHHRDIKGKEKIQQ